MNRKGIPIKCVKCGKISFHGKPYFENGDLSGFICEDCMNKPMNREELKSITDTIESKMLIILDENYGDNVDRNSECMMELKALFDSYLSAEQAGKDEAVREILEDTKRFVLSQGARLDPISMERLVVRHQIGSNTVEDIWYESQKRLTFAMANGLQDILDSLSQRKGEE